MKLLCAFIAKYVEVVLQVLFEIPESFKEDEKTETLRTTVRPDEAAIRKAEAARKK